MVRIIQTGRQRTRGNYFEKNAKRRINYQEDMVNKILISLSVIIGLLGCETQTKQYRTSKEVADSSSQSLLLENKKEVYNDKPSDSILTEKLSEEDRLLIDTVAVVIYQPISDEIESLKNSAGGEDEFDQIVMDNQYYQYEINKYFSSKPVKVIFSNAKEFVFKTEKGNEYTLNRSTLEDSWGTILFNRKKSPLVVNEAGEYESEVDKYFNW